MGVIGMFVGMSKNFWASRVSFLQIKKSQATNCLRWPYFTLLYNPVAIYDQAFRENSQRLLAVNYFYKKASS